MNLKRFNRQYILSGGRECSSCGFAKIKTEFYKSYSRLNKYSGLLPICKTCTKNLVQDLFKETKDKKLMMYYFCRLLDLVFLEKIFDSANSSDDPYKVMINYIKQCNNLKVYKNKSFQDSDVIREAMDTNKVLANNNLLIEGHDEFKVTPELMAKWDLYEDKRITDQDYFNLEKNYSELLKYSPDQEDKRICDLIVDICKTKMYASKAVKEGNYSQYKDLLNLEDKLLERAGLKTDTESDIRKLAIGEQILMIEKERPIAKPKEEFMDPDNIQKYGFKYFVNQMKEVLGLTKGDEANEE